MELKEARHWAKRIRLKDWNMYEHVKLFDVSVALDNRITELEDENEKLRDLVEDAGEIMTLRDRAVEEQHNRAEKLEAQRDELLEALLGFALKTSHHTPSLAKEWLQAIKIISSIKGKPWEEIKQSGVAD